MAEEIEKEEVVVAEEIKTDGDLEVKENVGATFEDGEEPAAPEKTTDENQDGKTTDENQATDGKEPGSDDDKKSEDGEKLFNQEAANKAFIENKKKVRAAEEATQTEKTRADELQAKLSKFEDGKRPEIPPMPDPFDEDHDAKVQAVVDANVKAKEWDRQEEVAGQAVIDQKQETLKKQGEERQEVLNTYNDRVKAFGFEEKEMFDKENIVDAYIKDPELVRFLFSHEDGPLAVAFLSANPREMDKIAGMSTADAAVYVSTNVLPNAQAMKPKTTTTPDPLEIIDGKGAKEREDPALAGAVFE